MSVLDELVARARARAAALPDFEQAAPSARAGFAKALAGRERLSVIAEFKRGSPSVGAIDVQADPRLRIDQYVRAGAAAISVLTEPSRFLGSPDDLRLAAARTALPLLLKDFVVAPVQVRQAAQLGASAVLLIVRCLTEAELADLSLEARRLGLDVLIECHEPEEIERALRIPGAVIGVNNRDLSTLEIDRERAPRLLARVPPNRIAVAESGYETLEQLEELRGRVDAVLVGTALMRAPDPAALILEVNR